MAAHKEVKPWSPTQERLFNAVTKPFSRLNTWLYRLSGGRIGGRWTHGEPILLLTYTGRKSGERRTTPLVFLRDGDALVIVASKGGTSKHPLWFLNLKANPDCEVEIGREKRRMRARVATAGECGAYWPRLIALNPDFVMYRARTTREIPIVVLTPL
jgi:deazaflavin-dependent oxidoreductase (nitroreductase family)